ncbi:MAG: hypothetical protein VYC39_12760 [Myxococcota bacterium]|nr:hypothetical protein [Myxococcota bacterium]
MKTSVGLSDSLNRFIEHSASDYMPDAASELLDLIESDSVEPLGNPGRSLRAEEVAERLEQRIDRIRQRGDESVDGLSLIDDAVAHLRAREADMVDPWKFEDGEGIRWFVLANQGDVIACYNSRPFIEADI